MNAKSNGISLESENSSIDRQNVSSSSSLLDILISTEQSNEPDPLDDFGNIGEAVIGQFAESFGMNQNFMENEFKMFDESYLKGTINSQKQTKLQKQDPLLERKWISIAQISFHRDSIQIRNLNFCTIN
uniref:Uncharacterized protein n=1 Tax=Caenorhabditis tropicalis TaxID=1561998 RepID=A0A1I7T7F3_9PELO